MEWREMKVVVLAGVLAMACVQAHAESDAEAAFRAAKAWTVRVQVERTVSFVEDEPGAFQGAGFVVDAERGWILTNAHVAGRSPTNLKIAFEGGKLIPAERVYVDPYLDVAVISYMPAQLKKPPPEPTLECDSVPPIGHPVGAFGHPWGFRFTGTRGIASAISSRFGADMLQTDAPINAGNSGGPLLSLETGRVVGISAAKIADAEVEGLSFAVPMPYACTIVKLLKAQQDPSPPVGRIDFAIDENDERTLYVANTRLESPGIDLQVGDEIVAVGDRKVRTPTQFIDAARGHLDGLLLTVRRDEKEIRVRGQIPAAAKVIERRGLWIDGALFAPVGDFYAGWLKDGDGLMVHHVDDSSEAASVGLQYFDVIERINDKPVHTIDELERVVAESMSRKQPIELLLIRVMAEGDRLFEYERRYLSGDQVGRVGGSRTYD
jgi:S1-C subfamily serine protease